MRRQLLRWTVCGVLNSLVAMAACAQQSSRVDTSITVADAVTLVGSASVDDNSAGAIVLLDAIRTGRVQSIDQLIGDLGGVVVEGTTAGARSTALSILMADVPGGYLVEPEALGELIEKSRHPGIHAVTITYLGVHPARTRAVAVLAMVAASEGDEAGASDAETAIVTLAEMGDEGRAVLADLHASGRVAPSAAQALEGLAQSGFRVIR